MLSGYFLIFVIIVFSIVYNVWSFTDRKKKQDKIEQLEKQIELMTKSK